MDYRVGELFILGFNGKSIPPWLREFERRFGLGGAILFDYDCKSRKYENNIYSPGQVTELCLEISNLPSRSLLFVDQEGGKVRRLKDGLGFAPSWSGGFGSLRGKQAERNSFSKFS